MGNGDQYVIHGQSPAIGPGATSYGNTYQQVYVYVSDSVSRPSEKLDLAALSVELEKLRAATLEQGTETEHLHIALEISRAADAAKAGDEPKAMEHLRALGKLSAP